jgi:hypothetical protein
MNETSAAPTRTSRRWPIFATAVACLYFGLSTITLPFTNDVWLGEAPLFAIVQLPKSFTKFFVQYLLLHGVHVLGLSRGSASPDHLATHGPAMAIMLTAPAFLLVAVLSRSSDQRTRRKLIAAVLVFASVDAIVTLWFDASSNLKLFNASYF